MIRLATVNDAEQLDILNDEFNGREETTLDSIRNSLLNNKQEIVVVADEDDILVGFVCVQLKKSFCYSECTAEITEVYVKEDCRKRGIAGAMISYAEDYCYKNFSINKFELLTEKINFAAQSVYDRLGYEEDGEIHLSK